jgi:hypothetical protein
MVGGESEFGHGAVKGAELPGDLAVGSAAGTVEAVWRPALP